MAVIRGCLLVQIVPYKPRFTPFVREQLLTGHYKHPPPLPQHSTGIWVLDFIQCTQDIAPIFI